MRAGQQLGAGQGALGRIGAEVEGDPEVGGAVPVQVAGEQAVVRPVGAVEQGLERPGLGDHVRLAGVPAHPGEQQHRSGRR